MLLGQILKNTAEDNPDKEAIPKAVEMIRGFLKRVNEESGKSENRFNLWQLDQQLVFKPGESAVSFYNSFLGHKIKIVISMFIRTFVCETISVSWCIKAPLVVVEDPQASKATCSYSCSITRC